MGTAITHKVIRLTGQLAITIILAAAGTTATASTFSAMTPAEVSTLLADKPNGTSSAGDHSAKERFHVNSGSSHTSDTVDVNVHDMITKVFGILEGAATRDDCVRGGRTLNADPQDDGRHVWVDSDRGYNIRYSGLSPQMSAAAGFDDNDSIAEYCYFFLFPYDSHNHAGRRNDQAQFCGSLLQEMNDMQINAGANVMTSDLFDVVADCEGRMVNVRLMDLPQPDADSGRYVVMFIVQPDAFAPEDDIAAL